MSADSPTYAEPVEIVSGVEEASALIGEYVLVQVEATGKSDGADETWVTTQVGVLGGAKVEHRNGIPQTTWLYLSGSILTIDWTNPERPVNRATIQALVMPLEPQP